MNIKELRIKTGLSQQELANKLGVHVNSILNWESGKTTISPKKLYLLNKLLNENTSYNTVNEPQEEYSHEDIILLHEALDSLKKWLEEVKKQPNSVERIMEEFRAKREIEKLRKEVNVKGDNSSKAS